MTTVTSIAVALSITPAETDAQEGNKPVSMSVPRPPMKTKRLADLMPADAAAFFIAPRIVDLLTDLDHLDRVLVQLHPEWGLGGLREQLRRRVKNRLASVAGLLPSSDAHIGAMVDLLSNEGLVDAGIDPQGPLIVVPDLESRVVIAAFELVDRPQFERWLVRVGRDDRQRLEIGGELATVVGPQGQWPMTCLARRSYALCQLSAPASGDPVRSLRRFVAFREPLLGSRSGTTTALQRSLAEMPRGAHLLVVGDTKKLAPRLAQFVTEWEARASRFAEPQRRQAALAHAAKMRKKIRHAARLTDGLAAGFYRRPGGMELQVQATLTPAGQTTLSWWLPQRDREETITRWTRTPALMRAVAHLNPQLLESTALSLGWHPPGGSLTGDFGLLAMGLDPLCALSKSAGSTQATGDGTFWSFVFPSALAVGITSGPHADQVQASLSEHLSRELNRDLPRSLSRDRTSGPPGAPALVRPRLKAEVHGSPFKAQVFDHLLILGMGRGMTSAGVRRLGALPPTAPGQGTHGAPFVDLAFYPRAIDAAFAAANIGPEHRASLRTLESLRLRWHPLMTRLREVRFMGRLDPSRSKLIVTGSVAH